MLHSPGWRSRLITPVDCTLSLQFNGKLGNLCLHCCTFLLFLTGENLGSQALLGQQSLKLGNNLLLTFDLGPELQELMGGVTFGVMLTGRAEIR